MSAILASAPLGFPWPTLDPFLFCAYHHDFYPKGNGKMGPVADLSGRHLGMDFEIKDGFRMYHGQEVPGFPAHPHRGFETITLVREGYVDHSDSLGATARFGKGDVQWMTAGGGIVHSEMFPLVQTEADNPLEMFQLWLNLPAKNKLTPAHFTMYWGEDIPRHEFVDAQGKKSVVTTVVGALSAGSDTREMPVPPPKSWASSSDNNVAVWTIALDAGASFVLPATDSESNRALYFFSGKQVKVDSETFDAHRVIQLDPSAEVLISAADEAVELLMLQGRPIAEPVAQQGPFVMNTREELVQAVRDYQSTRFGGWPHRNESPVHAREKGRFAIHADGKPELPPSLGATAPKG